MMTYNIRAGLGLDRRRSLQRIADVIASAEVDLAALQEVDVDRPRSGSIHQAARIAETTDMHCLFAPSFEDAVGGRYGNAVLTRAPARLMRTGILRHLPGAEPRGAMWVRLEPDDGPIDLINTHLSFRRVDRVWQIDDLLGPEWIGHPEMSPRSVVCGDLNVTPRDVGFQRLRRGLGDAHSGASARPAGTWPTWWAFRRIDHILVSPALSIIGSARVVRTLLARRASDHFPLIAEVEASVPRGSAPDAARGDHARSGAGAGAAPTSPALDSELESRRRRGPPSAVD